AGSDQLAEGEDSVAVAMAARQQESEHGLVDALLFLHGFGREAHLPPRVAVARDHVMLEEPELNSVGLGHGQAPLPFRRVMLPPAMTGPDRLQRGGHAHAADCTGGSGEEPGPCGGYWRGRGGPPMSMPLPGVIALALLLAACASSAPSR